MKRILFISPYTPLATKSRPYNFILHLAKKNEVYLIFIEDLPLQKLTDRYDYRKLYEKCHYIEHVSYPIFLKLINCILSIPTLLPLRVAYCHSNILRKKILKLIKKYDIDVIHVDRSRIANLVKEIKYRGLWVNLDFMVGLPKQTKEMFLEEMKIAAELDPSQITIYPYMTLGKIQTESPIPDKEQYELIEEAGTMLENAGIIRVIS